MTLTTPAKQKNYLAHISDSTLLLINGPDAGKFLQGQVTCDIHELSTAVTRIGAQCNPKGRILLSFRALQFNSEKIALRIPLTMLDSAINTLGKYIVFSKAKLQKGTEVFQLFGLYGPQANDIARNYFDDLPSAIDAWIEKNGNYLIRLEENRFECWITTENINIFQEQLAHQTIIGNISAWKLLDIKAGIAEVVPDTYELFTPQELNYQLINAINFRKGCYTGQEIVARLHYRGKLKRHMYRFSYTGNQLPDLGGNLFVTSSHQATGHIVNAAMENGEIEILASLQDEHKDNVHIQQMGEKLKRLPLPYAIPTADENTD